jgi:hypothetical protein
VKFPGARWFVAVVLLSMGCSSLAEGTRRDARLREELDQHRFQQPLAKVWPAAMRLVRDRHFELVGRDWAVVGEPEQSPWKRLTGGGFQTRRFGDHGLVLETRETPARVRLRVEGVESGERTCRVTFTAIRRTGEAPSDERGRDIDLELELVRRLEPDRAERITRAAETAK